jgi:hypothetical protein
MQMDYINTPEGSFWKSAADTPAAPVQFPLGLISLETAISFNVTGLS